MSETKKKNIKIKPYISPEDKEMLREKSFSYKKKRRISDYHIDAV